MSALILGDAGAGALQEGELVRPIAEEAYSISELLRMYNRSLYDLD